MMDILLRGGYTVEKDHNFQNRIDVITARAQFASGARAQVENGNELESGRDYAPHFESLADYLAYRENFITDWKMRNWP